MLKGSIRHFLCGLSMGTADAVPGVSGGTVALLLGFYDQLIASLKAPLSSWRFLLPLLCGIATAFLSLSRVIHTILENPDQRTCFYGLFFGLILVSIYFCAQRVSKWKTKNLIVMLTTTFLAYFLTEGMQALTLESVSYSWLMFAGFLAAGAMLLPGVSGSFIMVLLGVYPIAMGSIASITERGPSYEALTNLGVIAIGIVLGFALFTKVIQFMLSKLHDLTMAGLIGFMAGALPAVWPFWSLVAEGEATRRQMQLPGSDTVSLLTLFFMFIAIISVLIFEKRKNEPIKQGDR